MPGLRSPRLQTGPALGTLLFLLVLLVLGLAACSAAHTPEPTATFKPVIPVVVDLAGKIDAVGQLTEDALLVSQDGMAKVTFSAGSTLLGEDGQPPAMLSIAEQPKWRVAYELGPPGTRISPPVLLQICYDPQQLPAFEQSNAPELGFFPKTQESWAWLDLTIAEDSPCTTSMIEMLGTYVLVFDIPKGVPRSYLFQEEGGS